MSAAFVDTDVLVRLIAGDDPTKRQASSALFSEVEAGRQTLACPATVIADAVFVLTSPRLYAIERSLVAAALALLVDLPHFQVDQGKTVRRALDIFAVTRLDFGDAMLVAAMQEAGAETLYSFDRDYDHVPGIHRREP